MSPETQTNTNAHILLERYLLLIEISRELASTLELDVLLNRIVHVAADLSHTDAASILLYDECQHQLHFQASTNINPPLMRGLVVPLENSFAGSIVINKEPIIVSSVEQDPRHYSSIG